MSHDTKKKQGRIQQWQDDKGFGFIKSEESERFFFHVSDIEGDASQQRPTLNQKVAFIAGRDRQGRLKAKKVQMITQTNNDKASKKLTSKRPQKIRHNQAAFKQGQQSRLLLGIGFYAVLIVMAVLGDLNWLVVGWYAVIGVISFGMYAKDKAAVQKGAWRTPESTLHLLSLLGGWVGALMAQTYLRHKSKKTAFKQMFYMTVLINLSALVYIVTHPGLIENVLSLIKFQNIV